MSSKDFNGTSFKIEGLNDAKKGIEKLDRKLKGKVLRKSLMFATNPVLKSAKNEINSDTGTLKDAIRRSSKLYKAGAVVMMKLGIKSDRTLGRRNPVIYGPMHEEGSVNTKNKGFLRKAFDAHQAAVIERFRKKLADEIKKVAK